MPIRVTAGAVREPSIIAKANGPSLKSSTIRDETLQADAKVTITP